MSVEAKSFTIFVINRVGVGFFGIGEVDLKPNYFKIFNPNRAGLLLECGGAESAHTF